VDQISTDLLLFWLFILLALSAFFSSSETGMMRVNRYRLKSLANGKSNKSSAAIILKPMLKLFYPFVLLLNSISNGLLRTFGIQSENLDDDKLNPDELRAVVTDAGPMIPRRHQKMLLNILDLESATVEDIMIPRREIIGIDLEDDSDVIRDQLKHCQHTRILVFEGDVDNLKGLLHARNLNNLLAHQLLNKELIIEALSEVYYVPEGTPLHTQLLNFQSNRQRIGVVVDEYGDIQGIVTLEDILEEIVGEFTTDLAAENPEIVRKKDKSLLVDGGIALRELNRSMKWDLPTNGPKTLNGLIIEYLEFLPEEGTGFRLSGFPMIAAEVDENMLQWVRIYPELYDKNK